VSQYQIYEKIPASMTYSFIFSIPHKPLHLLYLNAHFSNTQLLLSMAPLAYLNLNPFYFTSCYNGTMYYTTTEMYEYYTHFAA